MFNDQNRAAAPGCGGGSIYMIVRLSDWQANLCEHSHTALLVQRQPAERLQRHAAVQRPAQPLQQILGDGAVARVIAAAKQGCEQVS